MISNKKKNPKAIGEDGYPRLATWELPRGDHQGGREPIGQGEAPFPCQNFPKAPIIDPEPLVALHPSNLSWGADKEKAEDMKEDNKEEDGTRIVGRRRLR